MEKAIIKTLHYADIFDYPLKAYEMHKWLIGRKANLRQVERYLINLKQNKKIKEKSGYYFFPRKDNLVSKRKHREKQSAQYLRKAQILATILKIIPWIKLIGISGGLSMDNATKADDIDLILVTSKKRLWISRILTLGLLSLTGQRRKVGEKGAKIAGKICVNTLLEEDKLEQSSKDIYLAHEVLQMKVVWQRDGVYSKYLSDNAWVFKFLPNWTTGGDLRFIKFKQTIPSGVKTKDYKSAVNFIEDLAKWFQLKIMEKPKGMERIEDGGLYFHPLDFRPKILNAFKRRISKLNSGSS